MSSNLTAIAVLAGVLFALPALTWSAAAGGHDCVKQGKQGYRCVKGPLAGQTFSSQQAMVAALRKGSADSDGKTANGQAGKVGNIGMKGGKGSAKKPS